MIAAIIGVVFLVLAGGGGGAWWYVSNQPVERKDIVGSCDMRGGIGESQICMDLTEINSKVEAICLNGDYKLSRTDPCDTKEALGGCASPRTITWYYPSSTVKTQSDAKKECLGDDKFMKP
jgi:hypothetical protein